MDRHSFMSLSGATAASLLWSGATAQARPFPYYSVNAFALIHRAITGLPLPKSTWSRPIDKAPFYAPSTTARHRRFAAWCSAGAPRTMPRASV